MFLLLIFFLYRVPEVSYFDAADLLGEVFVDTIDTVSAHIRNNNTRMLNLTVCCLRRHTSMRIMIQIIPEGPTEAQLLLWRLSG